jgi:UDP-GlcNAc:undecaprenyl-phosphate GlcNAc-1-phosphate transferase
MISPSILILGVGGISFLSFFIVKSIALHCRAIDQPSNNIRKIHNEPTPLLGGLMIIIPTLLGLWLAYTTGWITLPIQSMYGYTLGAIMLGIVGILDDLYELRARYILLGVMSAITVVVLSGMRIHSVTHPLGGILDLQSFFGGGFVIISSVLTALWLLVITMATKVLDGIDGLVGGLGTIGAITIVGLALSDKFYQPEIALFAALFGVSCFGFLVWNWHPAKIFLGESGSLFIGFTLAVLSLIAGSKILTTLLVLALPLLDMLWVMFTRIRDGRAIFAHDSSHIHHRLLNMGWGVHKIVMSLYVFTFTIGILAISISFIYKLILLCTVLLSMILFFIYQQRFVR